MHTITVGGRQLEVFGPYRERGRVWAVSASQQDRWAKALGARLPTPAEFDAIWAQADVRVTPRPRDVATAPLDALHDDVEASLGVHADPLVAAGKTWVDDGSGHTANYGWHVPAPEVCWSDDLRAMGWRGIKVYPCHDVDAFVIQPVGHAHGANHVDYSQLGYCCRELGADVVVDLSTGSSVPPAPRALRRTTPPLVGDDVRELQRALKVTADGVFGPLTEAAVRAYQRGHGLLDDGIVGPMTRSALAASPPDEDMPPLPPFEPLRGNAERARVFGRFAFVPSPIAGMPEAIRITDTWPARQLVQVALPQLIGVAGAPRDGVVTCHHLVADSLRDMWRAWEVAGLLPIVLSWAGLWCPRFIRGSSSVLSNHAWGTAFDVNARWNPLGAAPAAAGSKGSVRELVPIAHSHGWYWGGHFARPDGMHFEATEAAL